MNYSKEQIVFLAGVMCGLHRIEYAPLKWLDAFRDAGPTWFAGSDRKDLMLELLEFNKEFFNESTGTGDDVSGDGVKPDFSANVNCV